MKSATHPRSDRTRLLIIDSAAPIFNKKGYAGTSMSDLTTATGLTKGSIYGNFKDKDDVAVHAFQHNIDLIFDFFSKELKAAGPTLDKLLAYRVFADGAGRMNCSVVDVEGGILLVSQFTLSADTRKGLRPSFSSAMLPADARRLYEYALDELRQRHPHVAAGVFGADMQVSLTNDGPVTFMLEN